MLKLQAIQNPDTGESILRLCRRMRGKSVTCRYPFHAYSVRSLTWKGPRPFQWMDCLTASHRLAAHQLYT